MSVFNRTLKLLVQIEAIKYIDSYTFDFTSSVSYSFSRFSFLLKKHGQVTFLRILFKLIE